MHRASAFMSSFAPASRGTTTQLPPCAEEPSSHAEAEDRGFCVGTLAETTAVVKLYQAASGDDLAMPPELEKYVGFEIFEIGRKVEGVQRCLIKTYAGVTGWVPMDFAGSSKAFVRSPRAMISVTGMDQYLVGTEWDVLEPCSMRQEEDLKSAIVCELEPGVTFRINELGEGDKRRVNVTVELAGCEVVGWISTVTKQGEMLIGQCQEDESKVTAVPSNDTSPSSGRGRQKRSMFARSTSVFQSVFSKSSTPSVGSKFAAGDLCEAVASRTLRVDEDQLSKIVAELPPAAAFEILQMGSDDPKMCKVRTYDGQEGWILWQRAESKRWRSDNSAIKKSTRAELSPGEIEALFAEGKEYTTMVRVSVRSAESVDASLSLELAAGSLCTVVKIGSDRRQLKIKSPMVDGWITSVNTAGELTIDDPSRCLVGPLHQAASLGNLEELQAIVAKADFSRPNCTNKESQGRTALMLAAAGGHEAVVKYLLSLNGVDVNFRDDSQQTVLHLLANRTADNKALMTDSVAENIFDMILVAGGQTEMSDSSGSTPLLRAAAFKDALMVQKLMDAKANVLVADNEGRKAVELAEGNSSLVELLTLATENATANNALTGSPQGSPQGSVAGSVSASASATASTSVGSAPPVKKIAGKKKAKAKAKGASKKE
eukprot:TRINITY_DN125328_c0_g1_i1.p1 TRINITY_DN125328_c0_g1~~TRINITY_DN125328_c0_g1_i1.p1  ORF type:complete len:658 (-),score=169.71 TRINITY_DN125328_c0_g1_i1:88-2061(-)